MELYKSKLTIVSLAAGVMSAFALLLPVSRPFATATLGASAGVLIGGELMTGAALVERRKWKQETDDHLKQKLTSDTLNCKLQTQIKSLQTTIERLTSELANAHAALADRENLLIVARETARDLQKKLDSVGKFSQSEAWRIVRDTYNRAMLKLESHVNALRRNYPACANQLDAVVSEIDRFQSRWDSKLEDYENLSSFNQLLDVGLENQERIIEGTIELRIKAQTIVCRYLTDLLENTVPFDQYEGAVHQLEAAARAQVESTRNELQTEIRAIVSQWVDFSNQTIATYNGDFTEVLETGKVAVELVSQRDNTIEELQRQLDELRKPWQFPGTIDYARAGNIVINHYWSSFGFCLDAIDWEETEVGYRLRFATNRNKQFLTPDLLSAKDVCEQLQGLTNALLVPVWSVNHQSGLATLDVTLRKKQKKAPIERLEEDVNRIWVPQTKWESFVKSFERVRITSGSTGGKSPTAKNLALAILNARKGKGEICLYDPQHGSKKDYWNMPKAGVNHLDSMRGLQEMTELINSRRGTGGHTFVLYILDEVDNTVSQLPKKNRMPFTNLLKTAIKEGSHADVGAIFIGQSADANEVPNMTHSNWASCVHLHIGSNSAIAINNLKSITNEDREKLLAQYQRLQDYCDQKNSELGLDIMTDACALRFALVVPLSGLPKFVQLPDFDTYDYAEVMQSRDSLSQAEADEEGQLLPNDCQEPELTSRPSFDVPATDVNACPHCGGVSFKRNGRRTDGNGSYKQKYLCLNKSCQKTFTAS